MAIVHDWIHLHERKAPRTPFFVAYNRVNLRCQLPVHVKGIWADGDTETCLFVS